MAGPYIQDGHYMYGNAFIQPYPAYYNSSWYHRKPPRRQLSSLYDEIYDDGSQYVGTDIYGDPNDPVVRSKKVSNIINIETIAFRTLRIKLYAVNEEDDVDVTLEIGKEYAVTYMSEGGLKVVKGILKYIDTSIPDSCQRYVGNFNESVVTAWIGLDCSVTGKSDKRKIFIASIRGIEEVPYDEDYVLPTVDSSELTDAQKLNTLVDALPGFDHKLDLIIEKVKDNDEIMDKLDSMDISDKVAYIMDRLDEAESNVIKTVNDTTIVQATNIKDAVQEIKEALITGSEADAETILKVFIENNSKVEESLDTIKGEIKNAKNSNEAVMTEVGNDLTAKISTARNTITQSIDSMLEQMQSAFTTGNAAQFTDLVNQIRELSDSVIANDNTNTETITRKIDAASSTATTDIYAAKSDLTDKMGVAATEVKAAVESVKTTVSDSNSSIQNRITVESTNSQNRMNTILDKIDTKSTELSGKITDTGNKTTEDITSEIEAAKSNIQNSVSASNNELKNLVNSVKDTENTNREATRQQIESAVTKVKTEVSDKSTITNNNITSAKNDVKADIAAVSSKVDSSNEDIKTDLTDKINTAADSLSGKIDNAVNAAKADLRADAAAIENNILEALGSAKDEVKVSVSSNSNAEVNELKNALGLTATEVTNTISNKIDTKTDEITAAVEASETDVKEDIANQTTVINAHVTTTADVIDDDLDAAKQEILRAITGIANATESNNAAIKAKLDEILTSIGTDGNLSGKVEDIINRIGTAVDSNVTVSDKLDEILEEVKATALTLEEITP